MAKPETDSRQARWVEYMPVDDLQDAKVNPKTHNLFELAKAIEKFGFAETPVLDERTGLILHGHGRRDAIQLVRDSSNKVPNGVIVQDDGTWLVPVLRGFHSKDDNHAHATALALNKHTELGGWDEKELVNVLENLSASDPDLTETAGFTTQAFDDLRAKLEELDTTNENPYTGFPTATGTLDDDPANTRRTRTVDEKGELYATSEDRQVLLGYTGARYVWVVENLSLLAATYGTESNADTVVKMIEVITGDEAPTE